jgi:methionyl-tRNA formyltransferase
VRLVFLGSPPFATPVLERILASRRHAVLALVTRPEKPSGRGRKLVESPLAAMARSCGVPLLQPATTRDPEFVQKVRDLAPEVLVVASWGEILRAEMLGLAPHGALNVHASLLPRHRGASPVQAAILAGDEDTGVTVQRMVAKLDEGDILLRMATTIGKHETAGELFQRLAEAGGSAAVSALDELDSGTATFRPQDPASATYAKKLEKQAGWIDWTRTPVEIERHVRAMTPWPGARTKLSHGKELVLLDVRAVEQAPLLVLDKIGPETLGGPLAPSSADDLKRPEAGTILVVSDHLFSTTGKGLVEIRKLKPVGKGEMEGSNWLRGAHLAPGARFTS